MKKVFYCSYKITFPRKKAKLSCSGIIREIRTSREVLYTTLVRVISPCFAEKMLSEIRVFLAKNVSSSEKKLTLHVSKDFQVSADEEMGK